MPKQIFNYYDYFGPVAAALAFVLVCLLLSFFLLNFLLVRKNDDLTVFERFGSKHNIRLGPHSLETIKARSMYKHFNPEDDTEVTQTCIIKQIPEVKIEIISRIEWSLSYECISICTETLKNSIASIIGKSDIIDMQMLAPFHAIVATSSNNLVVQRKIDWISFIDYIRCERNHYESVLKNCKPLDIHETETTNLKHICGLIQNYSKCYSTVPFKCSQNATEIWTNVNNSVMEAFNLLIDISAKHLKIPDECAHSIVNMSEPNVVETTPILLTSSKSHHPHRKAHKTKLHPHSVRSDEQKVRSTTELDYWRDEMAWDVAKTVTTDSSPQAAPLPNSTPKHTQNFYVFMLFFLVFLFIE